MLAADRIDLWSYEFQGVSWNFREIGQNPDDYEVVNVLNGSYLYFAVQKDTDDELVSKLQEALDNAKAK